MWGRSSCPLSLKTVGNLGKGGALDDSSGYFGKCPVLQREWVEANLACERKKNLGPHLRSGFPGTHASGRPGAPVPKRTWGTESWKCHIFTHSPPPTAKDKERTHTHPHVVIKTQVCLSEAEGKTG